MSETEKADIVERLREYARPAIYRALQKLLTDAEIERPRALTSRDAVLEEAASKLDGVERLFRPDTEGKYSWMIRLDDARAAIRSLKKDTDNG